MTLPEILLALDEDLEKKRPPPGSLDVHGPGAKEEYARRWRSMGRTEKLKITREN